MRTGRFERQGTRFHSSAGDHTDLPPPADLVPALRRLGGLFNSVRGHQYTADRNQLDRGTRMNDFEAPVTAATLHWYAIVYLGSTLLAFLITAGLLAWAIAPVFSARQREAWQSRRPQDARDIPVETIIRAIVSILALIVGGIALGALLTSPDEWIAVFNGALALGCRTGSACFFP